MQLIATEIAQDWIQLTYADGDQVANSKETVMLRVPLQGPLKRPVLWHQMQALFFLERWAGDESRRLREQLEKIGD